MPRRDIGYGARTTTAAAAAIFPTSLCLKKVWDRLACDPKISGPKGLIIQNHHA
jgi:hypothetical protein